VSGRTTDEARERPRVLVLQHHARSPLGALHMPLAGAAELVFIRGYQDLSASRALLDDLRRQDGYDGLVVLGGPMAVYERSDHPYLDDSLRLVEDALEKAMPTLGLCLGAQLLSEAAGSRVYSGAELGLPPEVGFYPLEGTVEGRSDPVSRLFLGGPVLFWHRDTHDLPPGGVLLARTESYPVSAYRLAPNAYGLQFHLEITADLLQLWVAESVLGRAVNIEAEPLLFQAYRDEMLIRSRAESLSALFLEWVRRYRLQR
jgi:GMP synthase (glutamine-hydrolysing)